MRLKDKIVLIASQLSAGDNASAIAECNALLASNKDCAEAMHYRGIAELQQGDLKAAEQWMRQAIGVVPHYAECYLNLGVVLKAQGLVEQRIVCYQAAIRHNPQLTRAYTNLASAYLDSNDYRNAEIAASKALELEPNNPDAWINLGNAYYLASRYEDAIRSQQQAIALQPLFPEAYNNLGNAYKQTGHLHHSEKCYRHALSLKPDYAEAYDNLGVALVDQGQLPEALDCFVRALQLKPGLHKVRSSLLFNQMLVCDWRNLDQGVKDLRWLLGESVPAEILPFNFVTFPDTSSAEQRKCAEVYSKNKQRMVAEARSEQNYSTPLTKSRLRIGYLSADFRNHPVGKLIAPVLEHHDRNRFCTHGYGYGPDEGGNVGERIRKACDKFTKINDLSFEQAAQKIREDGIDILIDLTGYTQYNRAEILMLKPAPLQMNWLGFPGTMGLDVIDYLIGDPYLTPKEHAHHYSEKLLLLPVYQTGDSLRSIGNIPERAECGLPENGFVFCCWNNTYKITPPVFAIWMRLLSAFPGSVLWLYAANPWAVENLRQMAASSGIAPGRLVFMTRQPEETYLAMATLADLFLDTYPYNAGATANDMLFSGLPVLTCSGETYVSRMAGSLLTQLGMSELVARSLPEYEAKAFYLIQNPETLPALRNRQKMARNGTLLFDNLKFVRYLEEGLMKCWDNYCKGNPATLVEVTADLPH